MLLRGTNGRMAGIMPNQPLALTAAASTVFTTFAADPTAPATKPAVAITEIAAQAVQEPVGKRTYVIVTVKTDAGVAGVGEAPARPDPRTAVAQILARTRSLIGTDATAIERVRQSFISAPGVSQADAAGVQAALNMALLDIAGKLAKSPVYEVLGGATRTKARALAWLGEPADSKALLAEVQRAKAAGYRAMVVPLRLPEGPTRGRAFYRRVVGELEALRNDAGKELDFVLDCGGKLKTAEAGPLARELERFHLLWLDEPVGEIDRASLARISSENVTPLGAGRGIVDNREFLELLRADAVDALRPDIQLNGITSIRKAATLAEAYYVAVAPYHRGGPVATAAALHLAASIPNFVIQEVPLPMAEEDRRMRRELAGDALETPGEGFFSLPTGLGLGITLNQDAVRKYRIDA